MTTSTNGVHSASSTDADLDALYAWIAPPTPPPPPCPEATFSLTLRGTLDGVEALLTARGMTAAEFTRNLEAIKGLLDPKPAPASPPASTQGQDATPSCPQHGALRQGKRGWFCPKKLATGAYCEERWPKGKP